MFYLIFKRIFDILFSLVLILSLSPIIIILLVIITYDLKSFPVFFQKRAGLYGKPFYVFKLKSMAELKDENGNYLPDHLRITKFGNIVRKFSLDELPQLLNVFVGDMSFIGPRPFFYEYMSIYTDYEKQRHNTRPGISGWAQVNGRNNLTWKKKFKLDIYYVNNMNLCLDLKIIFLTFYKLINKNDINQNEKMTMEKYNGKN